MAKISFAAFALLSLACFANADWSVVRYFTTGGCSGDPLYVVVSNDQSECSTQECVTTTVNSVQTCCASSEPNPGSDFVAYKVHSNTDTCSNGDVTAELWFKLNSCLGYSGSFVKYTRLNETTVLSQTNCDDNTCTTGCSDDFFQLGCNGVSFGSTGSGGAISWEFTISDSASSINCNGGDGNTGTIHVTGGANTGSSTAPTKLFAFLAAAVALAVWAL